MQNKFNIGSTDFRKIRETDSFYVDKTKIIEDLIVTNPNDVNLITRPRRFGKTLMLNMLSEFFYDTKNSIDIFNNLYICIKERIK